jgi:hypothetical protein
MWKNTVEPDRPQMTNNTTHKRCDLHARWLRQQYRRTPQNMKYFLLFHGNYCLAKAPPCWVILTLPVLLFHDHLLKRASFYSVKHVTVTHTPIHVVLTGKEWRYINTIHGFPLRQKSTLPTCKYSTVKTANVNWSRYRSGVAQRVDRCIALLFHDRGTRKGWVVSSKPRPQFIPGKHPVPIVQEAGRAPGPVRTGGKSRPQRDSIPGPSIP